MNVLQNEWSSWRKARMSVLLALLLAAFTFWVGRLVGVSAGCNTAWNMTVSKDQSATAALNDFVANGYGRSPQDTWTQLCTNGKVQPNP